MIKISWDAGHGKNTPGKRCPDNSMHEWEFNSKVVEYSMKELAFYDKVAQLRVDDPSGKTDVPLTTRTNQVNNWGSNLHISVHANAFGSTWNDAHGIETEVYTTIKQNSETYAIAKAVQASLIKATGLTNRGVKKQDLHMVRETHMPAILIEHPFMTNKKEAALLKSDDFRKKCATAIVKALVEHYKLKKTSSVAAEKPKEEKTKKDDGTLHKVQVGAFSIKENADKLAAELKKKGYEAIVVKA